jgi:hypothetical protein
VVKVPIQNVLPAQCSFHEDSRWGEKKISVFGYALFFYISYSAHIVAFFKRIFVGGKIPNKSFLDNK